MSQIPRQLANHLCPVLAFFAMVFFPACSPQPEVTSRTEALPDCRGGEGPTDALCTTVEVFEDRAAAQGRRISLKVVVLPALSRDFRLDPLFVLVGGPGQGAAEQAGKLKSTFRKIQDVRDLVFVDQRGTGSSNPLDCEPEEQSADKLFSTELPADELKRCLEGYDADPRHYTTPLAMDDLDDVRATLGYEQVNLWGLSYGTRAALVYLRRHPERVRTVILDGIAPVNMKMPLYFGEDAQRSLDLLLAGCEAEPACGETFPDLRRKLDAVLERLERQPARVRLPHPRTGELGDVEISRAAVASILRLSLYASLSSSLVPLLVERAYEGDFQPLAAMASLGSGLSETMSTGMTLSVLCAEDLSRISPEEREQAAGATFLRGASLKILSEACEQWPRGEIPEDYAEPVVSDRPVLVLSGALDPVTPPRWGEEVVRHLSRARHVVVPGVAHGTLAEGCVPQLMADFLERGSADQLDVECVESLHRPPFFVNNAGPRPTQKP